MFHVSKIVVYARLYSSACGWTLAAPATLLSILLPRLSPRSPEPTLSASIASSFSFLARRAASRSASCSSSHSP